MLPAIRRQARHAFRDLPVQARQDLVDEVVGNCTVAVARLAEQGRLDIVYSTPLAMFAIKRVRSGRRTGVVARRFGVSAGRVSQIRAELFRAWQRFQGDDPQPGGGAFAAA